MLLSRRQRLIQSATKAEASLGSRSLLEQELVVVTGDEDLASGYGVLRKESPYQEERALASYLVASPKSSSHSEREDLLGWDELREEAPYELTLTRTCTNPLGRFLVAYCMDPAAALDVVVDLEWHQLVELSLRSFIRVEDDAEIFRTRVVSALAKGRVKMATALYSELSLAVSADACLQRAHRSQLVRRGHNNELVMPPDVPPPEIRRREKAREVLEELSRMLQGARV